MFRLPDAALPKSTKELMFETARLISKPLYCLSRADPLPKVLHMLIAVTIFCIAVISSYIGNAEPWKRFTEKSHSESILKYIETVLSSTLTGSNRLVINY